MHNNEAKESLLNFSNEISQVHREHLEKLTAAYLKETSIPASECAMVTSLKPTTENLLHYEIIYMRPQKGDEALYQEVRSLRKYVTELESELKFLKSENHHEQHTH